MEEADRIKDCRKHCPNFWIPSSRQLEFARSKRFACHWSVLRLSWSSLRAQRSLFVVDRVSCRFDDGFNPVHQRRQACWKLGQVRIDTRCHLKSWCALAVTYVSGSGRVYTQVARAISSRFWSRTWKSTLRGILGSYLTWIDGSGT